MKKPKSSQVPPAPASPWRGHLARSLTLLASLLLPQLSPAQQETPTEIHLTADLTGDARQDIIVIDRATGSFRAAYQSAPNTWTWSTPRATGVAGITGATAGRWFTTARESFAVAAPLANRSHIVQAQDPNNQPTLTPVFGQGSGPHALASPDIAGAGNTVHADLWIASRENGGGTPYQMDSIRHDGTDFTHIAPAATQGLAEAVRTVPLKTGGTPFVAYLGRTPASNDRLTILSYATSPPPQAVLHRFLPEGSQWTSGPLGNAPLHHILTWLPGETQFLTHPVTEGPPNVFSLAAAATYNVTLPIGQLAIVQSDLGPRLLVIAADGSAAEVYDFDGNSAPDFLQHIFPADGESINALLPLTNGGFQLLTGPAGTGTTTGMTHHLPDNGLFTPGQSTQLPDLRPAAMRANVFAFSGEPFVDLGATLIARYNVPEWSSAPILAGTNLTISRETYGGAPAGLGSKTTTAVGTVPVGTTFALTNQSSGVISVHSFDAGGGSVGADVEIDPPPGTQTQAFRPEFTPTPGDAPVRYRLDDGPWQSWPPPPTEDPIIHTTTTVRYHAIDPVTFQPSAIRTATYTFEIPPHLMDSDGDGLPDFVEIHLGLDPLGGLDHDGDGYSDLEEILAGTKPEDDKNFPDPEGPRPDQGLAFQLRASPRPIDGTTAARSTAALTSLISASSIDGTLLASRPAGGVAVPGIIGPGLRADNIVADDRLGVVSVITEPVFPIATPSSDKDRGREIARLFPIPTTVTPEILYTPGGGTLEDEADAWIAAAQAAYAALERPIVSGNFHELDTLVAFILEAKLEEILIARGTDGLDPNRLTLFGGRTGDAARTAPTAAQLDALRLRASDTLPGYNIGEMFTQIQTAVKNTTALADARTVATAIYRVSSASANAAPPGTYLPPFDVLRAFTRGGALPTPYDTETGITAPTLASAHASIAALLASLDGRPTATFALTVDSNSFSGGCHTLTDVETLAPVTLFAAPGIPYQSTDNFAILPGTVIIATGYTDLTSPCPGQALEVISISVLSFPGVPFIDTDGNLLPDDWEWAFLLGTGNDPWGDADGDGISNLQEYLDGTDPLCPKDNSGVPLLLSPPKILIVKTEDGQGVVLWWEFPQQYIEQIAWTLKTSEDLIDWQPNPAPVLNPEPGHFTIELPSAILDDPTQFYRIHMALK